MNVFKLLKNLEESTGQIWTMEHVTPDYCEFSSEKTRIIYWHDLKEMKIINL